MYTAPVRQEDMIAAGEEAPAINGICPYFTMFPLSFPLRLLRRAEVGDVVLDPFCGRGTTNLAARLRGLRSVGIDTSPVATAIARAKLVAVVPEEVIACARRIVADSAIDDSTPEGDFWSLAFGPATLRTLCKLRAALLQDRSTPDRQALTALLLGALHGPRLVREPSYFSNQMPRTFASKPDYSVRYWQKHNLHPTDVDVAGIIRRRAERYFVRRLPAPKGRIIEHDARDESIFAGRDRFRWVITSPPYYGLRTYVPDQWLRLWFLGGAPHVQYSGWTQLRHISPDAFASDLAIVWKLVATRSRADARMAIRFGGIRDRAAAPDEILKDSLKRSGAWKLVTSRSAGDAGEGRRQAMQFNRGLRVPMGERDYFAIRE